MRAFLAAVATPGEEKQKPLDNVEDRTQKPIQFHGQLGDLQRKDCLTCIWNPRLAICGITI